MPILYTYSELSLLLWLYGHLWSTMATCIVYYGCTYSFPSVLPIIFYTQLLYYAYLVFIVVASMLLSLHCLLCLPALLSTNSWIPCLVYTWLSSLLCLSSLLSSITLCAQLISFAIRSILSNRTYSMQFILSSHSCEQCWSILSKKPISVDSDSIK